ncbi:MAG: imidazole glycerol phosphate synthase subunit HisH [Chloroflexi bacterium]|nr:imidazole glycerol phosphate synthase subunit HisH [Chloroflexota bacterium]
MIGVVDFGAGNTRSVLRALAAVGAPAVLMRRPDELRRAERLVLPGVGAAGSAVRALQAAGLWDELGAVVSEGRPLLGICLGAQLMLGGSDEDDAPGLALLPGRCRAFPHEADGGPRIVPHVGWNAVDLPDGRRADAYFVHGYWLDASDPAIVVGRTEVDGFRFPSLLRSGHLTATQFHPEKSGGFGRALLGAFATGLLDGSRTPAAAWT